MVQIAKASKQHMTRVFVTGMGAITPIGNDVQTFWHNLVNGVCGAGRVSGFDTEDMPVSYTHLTLPTSDLV